MKYRKDFVTNSSSSSFVCDICGREESGWDMCLSEAEMYECENGHTFCIEEAIEIDPKKLIQHILTNDYNKACNNNDSVDYTEDDLNNMDQDELISLASEYNYEVPEMICPICQFIEYGRSDMKKYLRKEFKIPESDVFALIKEKNKRRKKIHDSEYIRYVCEKKELNPVLIPSQWKSRFNTYKEFSDYINS